MIDILMATFNGERYLKEQLDSILSQTYQDFQILIRDDNSTDNTVCILEDFKNKYPQKIVLIKDDTICGSSVSNFMQLSKYATSEYAMYCDQDDFWLPNKIEITLKEMKKIEKEIGESSPILVFADYIPVNENLKKIKSNPSNNQINAYNLDFNRLLVQNYVTGCLMMMNKALYIKMGNYRKEILMHDWWAALIASSMGRVSHIHENVMLYRQHKNNVVGAVNVKSMSYRIEKFFDKNTKNMKFKYRDQALLFFNRYKNFLDKEKRYQLQKFLEIYNTKSKLKRIIMLIRGKYWKSDIVRKIAQIWYI